MTPVNLVPLDILNELRFRDVPRPRRELQRWCRVRALPAKKIGGKWFVDLEAFDHRADAPPTQASSALARAILAGLRR